jgi:hypothetical protein
MWLSRCLGQLLARRVVLDIGEAGGGVVDIAESLFEPRTSKSTPAPRFFSGPTHGQSGGRDEMTAHVEWGTNTQKPNFMWKTKGDRSSNVFIA